MADSVIHISEEEAARDFASVLARVQAGGPSQLSLTSGE
jgi:hypothetical protein